MPQCDRIIDALSDKLPKVAEHLGIARAKASWPWVRTLLHSVFDQGGERQLVGVMAIRFVV